MVVVYIGESAFNLNKGDNAVEDYDIIQLLKSAPNDGLHTILSEYGGIIKAVITRILGSENRNEIEECISDTLLQFWRSVNLFDENKASSLKAYLCKIARNTAINRKRKLAKNLDIFLKYELASDFDIDDSVINCMNESAVTAAINSLPEPDRTIFIRRYYCCEAVKTIAKELGLDIKTVENKLHRRKAKLRNTLMERGIIL